MNIFIYLCITHQHDFLPSNLFMIFQVQMSLKSFIFTLFPSLLNDLIINTFLAYCKRRKIPFISFEIKSIWLMLKERQNCPKIRGGTTNDLRENCFERGGNKGAQDNLILLKPCNEGRITNGIRLISAGEGLGITCGGIEVNPSIKHRRHGGLGGRGQLGQLSFVSLIAIK